MTDEELEASHWVLLRWRSLFRSIKVHGEFAKMHAHDSKVNIRNQICRRGDPSSQNLREKMLQEPLLVFGHQRCFMGSVWRAITLPLSPNDHTFGGHVMNFVIKRRNRRSWGPLINWISAFLYRTASISLQSLMLTRSKRISIKQNKRLSVGSTHDDNLLVSWLIFLLQGWPSGFSDPYRFRQVFLRSVCWVFLKVSIMSTWTRLRGILREIGSCSAHPSWPHLKDWGFQ